MRQPFDGRPKRSPEEYPKRCPQRRGENKLFYKKDCEKCEHYKPEPFVYEDCELNRKEEKELIERLKAQGR